MRNSSCPCLTSWPGVNSIFSMLPVTRGRMETLSIDWTLPIAFTILGMSCGVALAAVTGTAASAAWPPLLPVGWPLWMTCRTTTAMPAIIASAMIILMRRCRGERSNFEVGFKSYMKSQAELIAISFWNADGSEKLYALTEQSRSDSD